MVGAACVGFYLRIYLLYCESASFYLLMEFWVGGAMWVGVPDGKTIIHNQGSGPGPQGWQSGAKWAIMPILHQGLGGGGVYRCTHSSGSLCHPDHKHPLHRVVSRTLFLWSRIYWRILPSLFIKPAFPPLPSAHHFAPFRSEVWSLVTYPARLK